MCVIELKEREDGHMGRWMLSYVQDDIMPLVTITLDSFHCTPCKGFGLLSRLPSKYMHYIDFPSLHHADLSRFTTISNV